MNCALCVFIERAWATASMVEPSSAQVHVLLESGEVRLDGLKVCPSCKKRRGPTDWCGDAYQSAEHALDVAAAESTWREGLAA